MTHLNRQLDALFARWLVRLILLSVALGIKLANLVRWFLPARRHENATTQPRRILITGSFYNDAWFDSHVTPLLAADNIDEVLVVTDRALDGRPGVRFCNPSETLQRRIGRIAARAVAIWRTARCYRPTYLMGYHIMPNALLCLLIGRWLGIPAIYQMTGGPVQLIDGGVGSENALLRRQINPGQIRAGLMHHLARQFDRIIVRGKQARHYLFDHGVTPTNIAIIPGAVPNKFFEIARRDAQYDLIAVGRLVEVKRYDRLLSIVTEVRKHRPDIRCSIVGDGPLSDELKEHAAALDINNNVTFLGKRTDVDTLLARARAYLLTSENEGLSIAMMEAMAAGLPAIVPNIGELGELLVDGETGVYIDAAAPSEAAEKIYNLLGDSAVCEAMGLAARQRVRSFAALSTVAAKWDDVFASLQARERGAAETAGRKQQLNSAAVQS